MVSLQEQFTALADRRASAAIHLQTLGDFRLWRHGQEVNNKEWGRDKTLQLFEYFITTRHRKGQHKEQILDRLWPDLDGKAGEQHFKVALHGIHKVLEPERESRQYPRYISRIGVVYQLAPDSLWIDADALEQYIAIGNQAAADDTALAIAAYRQAIDLYKGVFLPDRVYEDWSSEERERLQVLVMGSLISLGELLVHDNPMECVRYCQQALQIDHTWEDAYRLQMEAYFQKGNRPMAMKTYQQCVHVLEEEYGIPPLPQTKRLMERILQ
ncbi:MAG: bacterial transcriptional activator domain-containing protein [Saprospiraceae bacterium]